jgi:hypothetical protein
MIVGWVALHLTAVPNKCALVTDLVCAANGSKFDIFNFDILTMVPFSL